jgi:hypothetical protein
MTQVKVFLMAELREGATRAYYKAHSPITMEVDVFRTFIQPNLPVDVTGLEMLDEDGKVALVGNGLCQIDRFHAVVGTDAHHTAAGPGLHIDHIIAFCKPSRGFSQVKGEVDGDDTESADEE